MPSEFIAYKKFTDIGSSDEIIKLFTENNIECHIQGGAFTNLNIVSHSPINFGITLNIKPSDFEMANSLLEQYYINEIEKVDITYYLFDYTDAELKEIVEKPYEWGEFDNHLARKILNERGVEVNEDIIQINAQANLTELTKIVTVSKFRIITGYLFSVIFPPYSMIFGLLIMNNRNVLPDGKKIYLHSEADRKQGKIIVLLSFFAAALFILWAIIEQG
jgi:hypothetical protein